MSPAGRRPKELGRRRPKPWLERKREHAYGPFPDFQREHIVGTMRVSPPAQCVGHGGFSGATLTAEPQYTDGRGDGAGVDRLRSDGLHRNRQDVSSVEILDFGETCTGFGQRLDDAPIRPKSKRPDSGPDDPVPFVADVRLGTHAPRQLRPLLYRRTFKFTTELDGFRRVSRDELEHRF